MLNRRKGIPGTILNWNDKVRQFVALATKEAAALLS